MPTPYEVVDHVWAGHPVDFHIEVAQNHQFIVYYDADRNVIICGREIGKREWTRKKLEGVVTGWDSHNYLRLSLDRDGYIHFSGNMHNHPLVYWRSREPFDVSTMERVDSMTGDREKRCTYPVFFHNGGGDLFFRYRDGGSGNGSDIYNTYDTATRTWRRLLDTPLLDGQGQRNAYALEPVIGPDGVFHLIWMWRDNPNCETCHTLSYARSADLVHWETSGGAPIDLPITLDRGEVVDAAQPGEGLINTTFNLGFDARKKPVIVYHRYDAMGISQAFAVRPADDRTGWHTQQISDWSFRWAFSGVGSIVVDVNLGRPRLAPNNQLLVDYTTREAGSGIWQLDGDTLKLVANLPPERSLLPDELMKPLSGDPETKVNTAVARNNGRTWVLRWETMNQNRDLPRDQIPSPTELRLYEIK